MQRPIKTALLCAAFLFNFAQAAHAGEITLFTHDDFRGPSVTLRDSTRDLVPLRFNDTASSLIIRSGRWQLCVDADFRGRCVIMEPGEYRSLPGLNDMISSAREVDERGNNGGNGGNGGNNNGQGGWGGRPDRGNEGRQAAVMIFPEDGMRGRPLALNGDASDFVPLGFNDQSASMVIQEGNWQFCSDRDFRGQCRVFGPGEYRRLDPALYRSISSARRAGRDQNDGRPGGGFGDGRPGDGRPGEGRPGMGRAPVELFGAEDFRGARLPVDRDVATLLDLDFNDQAGSIVINEGQWQFCSDRDFRGQCEIMGPGRYGNLGRLNNQLTSIRRVR